MDTDMEFKVPKDHKHNYKSSNKKYPLYRSWSKSFDRYPPITSPFNISSPFENIIKHSISIPDIPSSDSSNPHNNSPPVSKKLYIGNLPKTCNSPTVSKKLYIDNLPLKCITKESVELSNITVPVSIKKVMESKLSFSTNNISNPDINKFVTNDFNHTNSIRYKKMNTSYNIIGFIVNVHDATNFDIDLDMSHELHQQYQDVISNKYTYQDLEPDFIENPDFQKLITLNPKIGITYRCRLKGIGINQSSSSSNHYWKSNQMCIEVKQLMDRTDGWVICSVSDVDVYQRLLVDIVMETPTESINLRNYLLSRMVNESNPIFYPYSSKRYRNKCHKKHNS